MYSTKKKLAKVAVVKMWTDNGHHYIYQGNQQSLKYCKIQVSVGMADSSQDRLPMGPEGSGVVTPTRRIDDLVKVAEIP